MRKTMKKLLLFLIAMLTFTSFCFAVDSSPPTNCESQTFIQFQTENQSAFTMSFDSVQDSVIVENKLIANQKLKAIAVSSNYETSAELNINKLTAKTDYIIFDLPPNLESKGYNGNIANKIRAEPVLNI